MDRSRTTSLAARLGVAVIALCALAASWARADQRVIDVSTAEALEEALSSPLENVTIKLAAGEYHLTPDAAVDETCGNCEDPGKTVPVTVGLRVSGRSVWIEGPVAGEAVIYTHAGYGVLFEDCEGCKIVGVTVTGGERDESPDATDAAVVVRRGKVYVQNCDIRDNIGDAALLAENVVGIMGICGREGANLFVYENTIRRNSWDGIALYRDAEARIFNNVIDGVDRASGKEAGGGRGVGIGVTWNAKARIDHNLIRRYWKGVGVFVDAQAQVVNNVVEEMTTWGISVWDAGKGKPSAAVGTNVVYDCGACGVAITREAELGPAEYLSLTGNIVVKTAQNPKYDDPEYYCAQCALAVSAAPEKFVYNGNIFFDNRRASDDLPDYDLDEETFLRAIPRPLSHILGARESYAARVVFVDSSFLKTFAAR